MVAMVAMGQILSADLDPDPAGCLHNIESIEVILRIVVNQIEPAIVLQL
jgi:hypothetical protein